MSEQTIVVLGGGLGGVVAAGELRGRLKEKANVILVERNPLQAFPPSYLWVMTGERTPEAITRDITKLERRGIDVVTGEVRKIDLKKRTVTVDKRVMGYDYLVIALGAETAMNGVPGLADAQTYFSVAGAERLRETIASFEGGKIAMVVAGLPYKCPASPYEGAMLLEGFFHSHHIRHKVELNIYTPEPAPMPIAGKSAGENIQEMLAHKGIGFHPQKQVAKVKGNEATFEDDSTAPFDLMIAVPPHRPPQVVQDAGITDDSGWIPVDKSTLQIEVGLKGADPDQGVYAIGDATRIVLPDGMELPKAAVFAHGEAEVVARNIAARILGQAKREKFDGTGYCFLETGGGAAGMAQGNFYASPRHIGLRTPSPVWHWGKVAFERYWLWKWF